MGLVYKHIFFLPMTCKFRFFIVIYSSMTCVLMCVFFWLPSLVNFLVILGSQHPFSFNFYFMPIYFFFKEGDMGICGVAVFKVFTAVMR